MNTKSGQAFWSILRFGFVRDQKATLISNNENSIVQEEFIKTKLWIFFDTIHSCDFIKF